MLLSPGSVESRHFDGPNNSRPTANASLYCYEQERHRDTETQRHRDTETQRHRDTETQRHRERTNDSDDDDDKPLKVKRKQKSQLATDF